MKPHSLVAGLGKYALASAFIRKTTPAQAFPEVEIVRYGKTETIETPEISGMDLYPQGRYLQSPIYSTPECYGMVLPNALYYPRQGVILDEKRRVIEDLHQVPIRKHWHQWSPFFARDIAEQNGNSFVFRSFAHNIFHLLTDHLPALFMLGELPWQRMEKINLLLPVPLSAAQNYLVPKLCPSNVDIIEVDASRMLRLERYFYVSQLAQRGCGFLPDYYLRHFLERVSPRRPRNKNRRIYISRTKAESRRIINEEELVNALKRSGFESYALEDLPVEEQIETFHDAEFVVAAHGAGLVNLLFSEGAKVLELFPGPSMRPHYYFLSKARGHQYAFLRARESQPFAARVLGDFEESFNGSTRDFSVDCERVMKKVQEMLATG